MKLVNKHIILFVIGLMIFILGYVGVNYIIYKNKSNTEFPDVTQNGQDRTLDTFAIMLEQTDGSYKLTSSSSFNQSGYVFNYVKSGCVDVDGNKVDGILTYNGSTKTVEVTSNESVYCYVYFDIEVSIDPVEIITTIASPDEVAYDETTDNNLRYIGANPNNYIYFNCSDYDNPTASTCEKWRIIGAFNNIKTSAGETKALFKIIRNESLGEYYWDAKLSGVGSSTSDYGSNDWSDSQLMLMLNGVSLGNYKKGYTVSENYLLDKNNIRIMNISGCYYEGSSVTYLPYITSTSGYSSTETVDFSNTGLKNDATRGMIENVVWKLGGVNDSVELASRFYSYERGTNVYSNRPTEWTGKIGLMYPSDYGYATGGGTATNRETCLASDLYGWDSYDIIDCQNNDWLLMRDSSQRTLTPEADHSGFAFIVHYTGYVLSDGAHSSGIIRPTVYLTSNIGISGGDGTVENPYTLEVN